MNDNQIRIPSADYTETSAEEIIQIYNCVQSAECPTEKKTMATDNFEDTYNTVTANILQITQPFPVASAKPYSSPIISSDGVPLKSARDIYLRNANTRFDEVLISAKEVGPVGITQSLYELNEAVYWARRAGMSEEEIKKHLQEIEEAYEPWFKVALPEPVVEIKPEEKPETKPAVVQVEPLSHKQKPILSVSPLITYEGSKERSYIGTGVAGEILFPLSPTKPWVVGGELQIVAKAGFDEPTLIGGEIKDIVAPTFPLLLEAGYRFDHTTILLQTGGWFTAQPTPSQARDTYSNNISENLTFRVGIKTSVFQNRYVLEGGFQQSPSGPGGYVSLGYRFGN